jgi:uncharacterized membrane protein
MRTDILRTSSLMAATMSMGLIAGTFALYAHTIMPGLKQTDDGTFVAAFQAIDRSIINPWFIGTTFIGAIAFTATAAITSRGTPALAWIVTALVAFLVAVVVTAAVHVPLNDAIKAAGTVTDLGDVAHIRHQFHATRWAAWNLVRVIASTFAFACLTWALVLHGRTPIPSFAFLSLYVEIMTWESEGMRPAHDHPDVIRSEKPRSHSSKNAPNTTRCGLPRRIRRA